VIARAMAALSSFGRPRRRRTFVHLLNGKP
jgi:hypothetical protein